MVRIQGAVSAAIAAASVQALNIVLSNDDGWATANIRAVYNKLTAAGHKVLLVAPATNQSGTGGSLTDPTTVGSDGGEFGSIPAGAPAEGQDANDTNIWYVNATPASSVRFALSNLTEQYFGGAPDLVVTGVNQGNNLGLAYLGSGTEGAAKYAVGQNITGVAFSGANSTDRSYTTLGGADDPANVYADLVTEFVAALTQNGAPYTVNQTGINVNFPNVDSTCSAASSFKFVQTRLVDTLSSDDFCTCGQTSSCKLPTESDVVGETDTCESSVSVFNLDDIGPDGDSGEQQFVNAKLGALLTCDGGSS